MESAISLIQKVQESSAEKSLFEAEQEARAERDCERYNNMTQPFDGIYNCTECGNRGGFMKKLNRNGYWYTPIEPCKCVKIRKSILRMRASGLENTVRKQTFETFVAETDFQKTMLETAKAFVERGAKDGDWFFIGGAVGCGKTHICTAIARELLHAGNSLYYMPWHSEVVDLKRTMYDDERYADAILKLKTVDVLYIDDFFKPVADMQPSPADIRIAYDIINYRYINRLTTIISSEKYIGELMDIDEATGSRIYECSSAYRITVKRDTTKNYRTRDSR